MRDSKRVRNVALLQAISDRLTLANYNQGVFCGSACCLAGHACVLTGFMDQDDSIAICRFGYSILTEAVHATGLTYAEGHRLFGDGSTWPDPFTLHPFDDAAQRLSKAKAILAHLIRGGSLFTLEDGSVWESVYCVGTGSVLPEPEPTAEEVDSVVSRLVDVNPALV